MPTMPSFNELSKKLPAKLPARPAFTVPEPARHVVARAVRAGDRLTDEVTAKLRHRGAAGNSVAARAADALAWSSGVSRRLSAPLRDAVLLDPGTSTEASTEAVGTVEPGVGAEPGEITAAGEAASAPKQAARPRARRKQAGTEAG